MKKIIFDFNRTLYNPDTKQLVPGTLRVLNELAKRGYVLQLISRNEGGRKSAIETAGIASYFTQITLTQRKTAADFKKLAGVSSNVFVVGDRVREEITIGNRLGYHTIWFKNGKFAIELPQTKNQKPTKTITRLIDVLNSIP